MNPICLLCFWILALLSFASCSSSGEQAVSAGAIEIDSTLILKPIDIGKGGYSLYVLRHLDARHSYEDGRESELFCDTLTSFYTDNYSEINKKINDFHGTPVNFIRMCSYDYSLIVTHNDSIMQTAEVNRYCNFLVSEKGAFTFDSVAFDTLIMGLKRVNIQEHRFSNIQIARKQWENLTANEPLVIRNYYKPEWINYDGYFTLIQKNGTDVIDSTTRQLMTLTYPHDTFEFISDYTEIKSSKAFYRKFNLVPKSKWTDYAEFIFTVIEKQKE